MEATSKHKSSGHLSSKHRDLLFRASMVSQGTGTLIYCPGRRFGRFVAPEFLVASGHCVQTYGIMKRLGLYNLTYVQVSVDSHRWHVVMITGEVLSIAVSRTEFPNRRDAFGVVLQQIQNHHSSTNSPEKV